MIVPISEARELATNPHFQAAVSVGKVDGGSMTLPFWLSKIGNDDFKEALEDSLQRAGYGAKAWAGKYQLTVEIVDVDQDWFGMDLNVSPLASKLQSFVKMQS